eukprot:609171-Prymnesium_polylepis.1
MRGGRGRCACHTETATASRFDVPTLTSDTTWEQAEAMLNKVPTLTSAGLRNDAHTPPDNWDYSSAGPWTCAREGCAV